MTKVKELVEQLELLLQEVSTTTSQNLDKRTKPSTENEKITTFGDTREFQTLHAESIWKKSSSDLWLKTVHDGKVSTFGAIHELEDKQIQVDPLDLSCSKSDCTSDNSTVENLWHQHLFSNCKDFAKKYKVIRKLGQGRGGTVYRGWCFLLF